MQWPVEISVLLSVVNIFCLCVCVWVWVCARADRQDLEESEKVDVLQEPMLDALKVGIKLLFWYYKDTTSLLLLLIIIFK